MTKYGITKSGDDYDYVALSGRKLARLVKVEVKELPSFEDKSVLEKKLMLIFEALGVKLTDKQRASGSYFARPSMSDRSKLYKLLGSMDKEGKIPEIALSTNDIYEAYIDDFIGQLFHVTFENTGKYNNVISAFWAGDQTDYPTRDQWLLSQKAKDNKQGTKSAERGAIAEGIPPRFYRVPKDLEEAKKTALIAYLTKNGAKFDEDVNCYVSFKDLGKAEKYLVTTDDFGNEQVTLENDEIPF